MIERVPHPLQLHILVEIVQDRACNIDGVVGTLTPRRKNGSTLPTTMMWPFGSPIASW